MNTIFNSSPSNQAPKRTNSGRELPHKMEGDPSQIMYIQNHRLLGSGQPVDPNYASAPQVLQTASQIPQDVADVFNTVLRKYSYRDIYRWLKIDRQDEINRFSTQFRQTTSDFLPGHITRPSIASSARTSRTSSVFSMPARFERNSFASTNTAYSIMSEPAMDTGTPLGSLSPEEMEAAHHVSVDGKPSMINGSPATKAMRNSSLPTPKQSARQRESELEIKKRYYCTACNKGFARKYDWKVHEQRYHEQQAQYPCPDCNQVLYAETHFRSHHRDAHGCQQCTHAKEVTKEVDPRRRRTAWGCGFCGQLLDDWEKRCDHISAHYDEGLKRADWEHSKVIIGLLRQPDIDGAWQSLLIAKHGQHPNPPLMIRWNKETTARSHGDSLQLQDLLELGAIGRDVQAIVQLAYEQGYRPPDSSMSLPTVGEADESEVSPPTTEGPQDSVMASPTMEPASLPPTSQPSYNNFMQNQMTFTPPQQHQQPHQQQHDPRRATMTVQSTPIENWSNYESMFQNANFMANHHQSMPPYADKALPPLPPTPVDTDMMLQSQNSGDAQVAPFETWSMLTGSTFADDTAGMMIPTFDPRNQF